jgi:hypothetical protein
MDSIAVRTWRSDRPPLLAIMCIDVFMVIDIMCIDVSMVIDIMCIDVSMVIDIKCIDVFMVIDIMCIDVFLVTIVQHRFHAYSHRHAHCHDVRAHHRHVSHHDAYRAVVMASTPSQAVQHLSRIVGETESLLSVDSPVSSSASSASPTAESPAVQALARIPHVCICDAADLVDSGDDSVEPLWEMMTTRFLVPCVGADPMLATCPVCPLLTLECV